MGWFRLVIFDEGIVTVCASQYQKQGIIIQGDSKVKCLVAVKSKIEPLFETFSFATVFYRLWRLFIARGDRI